MKVYQTSTQSILAVLKTSRREDRDCFAATALHYSKQERWYVSKSLPLSVLLGLDFACEISIFVRSQLLHVGKKINK